MLRGFSLLFLLIISTTIYKSFCQPLLNWEPLNEINATLPDEIRAYKAAGRINGDTITAFYTISDVSSGRLVFFPMYSETNQKPESFYDQDSDEIYVITNGGFFGTNVSYSLLHNNYTTLVPNIRALTRTHDGSSYTYYPTRSAFGIKPGLEMEAAYVYTFSNTNETFAYPEASPNTTDSLPLPQPTPDFPENGALWNVSEAIGGGPLLIRDSIINTNYTPELFYSDITQSQAPRTAIGCTSNGEMINLVVDGRQAHSQGATLQVLAEILLELGCIEAINLDGGGSSVMMVRENIINLPSSGLTRSIPTVAAIKRSHLFDTDQDATFFALDQAIDTIYEKSFGTSGTLLMPYGNAGYFVLNNIPGALYRVEAFINSSISQNVSDSVYYLFSNGTDIPDSVYLNQNETDHAGFVHLGFLHLAQNDSICIHNASSVSYAQIDAIRLIKTGSSLPTIELNRSTTSGSHAQNEHLEFQYIAASQTHTRPLIGIKIIETYNNQEKILLEKALDNLNQFEDTLDYPVEYAEGNVHIQFIVYDILQDSASITYQIEIDNSPPLLAFGVHSELEGNAGDTLAFELIMNAASTTRHLDRLEIKTFQNSSLIDQSESELSGTTANIMYYHPLDEEDMNGFEIRFRVYDIVGYWSENIFQYSQSNIHDVKKNNACSIYFDPVSQNLYYKINIKSLHKEFPVNIRIYNNLGMCVYQKNSLSNPNGILLLSELNAGFYIVVLENEKDIISHKFIKDR